jgi:ABC-type phosphate/phosphonate transport system substrate-binding protein
MYDRPETYAANDRLWSLVAAHLDGAPEHMTRDIGLTELWTHPDLLLSQTCGLPFALGLHTEVHLVAAPDFRLEGCPPGYYCSAIITRTGETRDLTDLLSQAPIVNERISQSGHNALNRFAETHGVPLAPPAESGGHRASAQAVAEGRAGIAAIDANSWRMIARWDDFANDLTVVAQTPPTPAMPFICGPNADAARVRQALATAIATLDAQDRDTLGLHGLAEVPKSAYLAVPHPPL